MKAALFLAAAALLLAAAPPSGATFMKQVTAEVYCPADCQAYLADAGATATWTGNYGTVTGRYWYFSDAGLGAAPNWPASLYILQVQNVVGLCASSQICKAYSGNTDSAVDSASSSPSFCAVDATCMFGDGGIVPVGQTWTGVTHSGNCQAKPTSDLFLSGNDTSWPSNCPLF